MSVLGTDRNTQAKKADVFEFPIKAGIVIFRGALTAIDATGQALRPQDPGAVQVVGVAQTGTYDFLPQPATPQATWPTGIGTVGAGPVPFARVRRHSCFCFANSAAGPDQLGAADWGKPCFAADDGTLAKTDGGGTRLQAGIFRGLDAIGAWVEI